MGEWKVQVSVRVLPEMRRELEVAATREHRTLGNLGGILMEWAFAQLRVAGSSERLLKYRLANNREKHG
jgi:hypothetical protein